MDLIKSVLQEELESSLETQKYYQKEISKLPRGSLSKKKTGGKAYYYLSYKEGSKVKTDYLGKLSDEKIKDYQDRINKRRHYQSQLRKVTKKIKYLRKVLNVKAI
ncbi:MAG: hypothetical protein K8T10_09805 [Candidatus Eremiobacteraeota bacterium]|nr:hypothetical protein [Candidatus Eremiobacteraeota bacterium]